MRMMTLTRLPAALLIAGGAGVQGNPPPLPALDGAWVGDVAIRSGDLGSTGPRDGELRLMLEQHGTTVTGRVNGPGLRGTVRATLHGDELAGRRPCRSRSGRAPSASLGRCTATESTRCLIKIP